MSDRLILLVEDNPDDEALTLRALDKGNVDKQVVVVHDGMEALDYLFATGDYAGRDLSVMSQLVLLDLKLRRVDGLEVLRRIRADDRTKRLPVVILTSSKEDEDVVAQLRPGRQQLRSEAGGLHPVRRSRSATGTILARLQRTPAKLKGELR